MEILNEYSHQCGPGVSGKFVAHLEPRQAAKGKVWLILDEAITPDDERPTEVSLAKENWAIDLPSAGTGVVATGSRIGCEPTTHEKVLFLFTPPKNTC
jgi:hypothetical protein